MGAQNLISVRQIRGDELTAFIENLVSMPLSGTLLQGVNVPLSSGTSQIGVQFSGLSQVPIVNCNLGSSGASDPYIQCFTVQKNLTGALIGFSEVINSQNYYADLIFSV